MRHQRSKIVFKTVRNCGRCCRITKSGFHIFDRRKCVDNHYQVLRVYLKQKNGRMKAIYLWNTDRKWK